MSAVRLWNKFYAVVLAGLVAACGSSSPEQGAPDGAVGVATDGAPTDRDANLSDGGAQPPEAPFAGVFGGGPFYHDAEEVMPLIRASGFSSVLLWSIHIGDTGDLILNDVLLVSDGVYVGDPSWPALVASLRTPPTSVRRIEFSVGSYGVTDFERIEALLEAQGSGPDSVLYRNFAELKRAIPAATAINYDDESNYDVASTVELSLMLREIGYRISFAPYTRQTFWGTVYDELEDRSPGLVDRVLLQVYAGGANNRPVSWNRYFGDLQVEAGLWSRHGRSCSQGDSPERVGARMRGWADDISGGWMWLLDDMLACDAMYPLEDYATAIRDALAP